MELDEAIAFINDRARDFINSNQKKLVKIMIAIMLCRVFWLGVIYMILALGG